MRRPINRSTPVLSTGLVLTSLILPLTAQAYVGPGAGLSLLTALWGLVAAIGVAVFFLVMWPIRRMRRRKKEQQAEASQSASQPAPETTPPPVQQSVDDSDGRQAATIEVDSPRPPGR